MYDLSRGCLALLKDERDLLVLGVRRTARLHLTVTSNCYAFDSGRLLSQHQRRSVYHCELLL